MEQRLLAGLSLRWASSVVVLLKREVVSEMGFLPFALLTRSFLLLLFSPSPFENHFDRFVVDGTNVLGLLL